jgi:hypothetical protein
VVPQRGREDRYHRKSPPYPIDLGSAEIVGSQKPHMSHGTALFYINERSARRPPFEKANAASILQAHNVAVAIANVDMWAWRIRQAF